MIQSLVRSLKGLAGHTLARRTEMISQVAGRIACVFGVHQRSRGQVREIEGRLESRCKFCGTPMEKTARSTWTVTRQQPAHED
jgi:hypothetical protein